MDSVQLLGTKCCLLKSRYFALVTNVTDTSDLRSAKGHLQITFHEMVLSQIAAVWSVPQMTMSVDKSLGLIQEDKCHLLNDDHFNPARNLIHFNGLS
jgi:hypothetical protein